MFSIIVAFDKNQLIGKDNKLPWHYKEDLKYFKDTTTNKTVLMGRNTFDSIINYLGKPLPNRKSIVVTTKNIVRDDIEVINNIDEFIEQNKDSSEEIFIIGGKSIYEQFLPFSKKLYITHISNEYEGDTHFPTIEWDNYKLIKETKTEDDELSFNVYERV